MAKLISKAYWITYNRAMNGAPMSQVLAAQAHFDRMCAMYQPD
jgi:hypothetical protein